MNAPPLLEARNLQKHFAVKGAGLFAGRIGTVRAVEDVSFALAAGETFALVGESGCGKTTLARTLALLHRPSAGAVLFRGKEITGLKGPEIKAVRRDIQMIFQDPYGSLDPRMTVATIVSEPLRIHRVGDRRGRAERVRELMDAVGLSPALADRYPHEFSGGQRQRIGIARALALNPKLVIADEPVSALDVSVQSQVLNLLQDLQEAFGLTYLLVSHDLAVVAHMAHRVAVMYLGRIVETAPRDDLFARPSHPYTQALLRAVPRPGGGKRRSGGSLGGEVPNPLSPPAGCPFHPRCPRAEDICRRELPALEAVPGSGDGHRAACHFKGWE
ncbi:MAG: dipeptide ABC transporter ATP-binding protein [Proteobacteria bacterium]|nr:dipeptide ABC transporter ATP-binding protein [Pseudomonadota bacterium]